MNFLDLTIPERVSVMINSKDKSLIYLLLNKHLGDEMDVEELLNLDISIPKCQLIITSDPQSMFKVF